MFLNLFLKIHNLRIIKNIWAVERDPGTVGQEATFRRKLVPVENFNIFCDTLRGFSRIFGFFWLNFFQKSKKKNFFKKIFFSKKKKLNFFFDFFSKFFFRENLKKIKLKFLIYLDFLFSR